MVNAAKIAMQFHAGLPANEALNLLKVMKASTICFRSRAMSLKPLSYIIRDFDRDRFNERKANVQQIANDLKAKYGENSITVDMNDQYYNMREKIEPVKEIVDIAYEAMKIWTSSRL